jgi:hypothetical protein
MASARAFAHWLHGAWKSNVARYGISSTYEEHCGAKKQHKPHTGVASCSLNVPSFLATCPKNPRRESDPHAYSEGRPKKRTLAARMESRRRNLLRVETHSRRRYSFMPKLVQPEVSFYPLLPLVPVCGSPIRRMSRSPWAPLAPRQFRGLGSMRIQSLTSIFFRRQ